MFDEKNYSKNLTRFKELEEMYQYLPEAQEDRSIQDLLEITRFFINMTNLWGSRYDTLQSFCEEQAKTIKHLEYDLAGEDL